MATHPWLSKSTQELLEIVLSGSYPPNHPAAMGLELLIQQRIADAQLQASAHASTSSEHLAELTAALVQTTKALVNATWAVAIVTGVLGLITVIPMIVKCAR